MGKLFIDRNLETTGKQKIEFEIAGKKYTADVDVIGIQAIIECPDTIYTDNKPRIKVRYTDGSDAYIDRYTIVGMDTVRLGTQEVTAVCGGVSKKFTAEIRKPLPLIEESKTIDSIYIGTYSQQGFGKSKKIIDYKPEITVDRYISSFFVKYSNGEYEEILVKDAKITGLDVTTPGLKNITVEYAGLSFNTTINVVEKPVSIDLSNITDTIQQYCKLSGQIKATYADGTSETVDITDKMYGYLCTEEPQTVQVEIFFKGCWRYKNITIVPSTKRIVNLDFTDIKTEIVEFTQPLGLVKVIFEDGTSGEVDIFETTYLFDDSKIGSQEINITWEDFSAPLTLTIIPDPKRPQLKDGKYLIDTRKQLIWYIRKLKFDKATDAGALLSTDFLINENLIDNSNDYKPYVSEFLLATKTQESFLSSFEAKEAKGNFNQEQIDLIRKASRNINFEDIKVETKDGKTVTASPLIIRYFDFSIIGRKHRLITE